MHSYRAKAAASGLAQFALDNLATKHIYCQVGLVGTRVPAQQAQVLRRVVRPAGNLAEHAKCCHIQLSVHLLLSLGNEPDFARTRNRTLRQGVGYDSPVPAGGACPIRSPDSRSPSVPRSAVPARWIQQRPDQLGNEAPRTHVARLFLRPHDLGGQRIPQKQSSPGLRERVELLHADHRHVLGLALFARRPADRSRSCRSRRPRA